MQFKVSSTSIFESGCFSGIIAHIYSHTNAGAQQGKGLTAQNLAPILLQPLSPFCKPKNYCSDSEDPWFRNKGRRQKGIKEKDKGINQPP